MATSRTHQNMAGTTRVCSVVVRLTSSAIRHEGHQIPTVTFWLGAMDPVKLAAAVGALEAHNVGVAAISAWV
jgi:hypothetical protein